MIRLSTRNGDPRGDDAEPADGTPLPRRRQRSCGSRSGLLGGARNRLENVEQRCNCQISLGKNPNLERNWLCGGGEVRSRCRRRRVAPSPAPGNADAGGAPVLFTTVAVSRGPGGKIGTAGGQKYESRRKG